jgi:glycosyltransferase involved in cell wall biosynthesis
VTGVQTCALPISEAIADAIGRLLSDDALRARFSGQAKELIRTKYNWPAIVHEIEALYAKVTNGGRSGRSPPESARAKL